MKRRNSLSLMAAAIAAPWVTNPVSAAPALSSISKDPSLAGGKPYDLIKPAVLTDSNRVRFLFSYDCPYCRSYHNGLTQWGSTLPKTLRFDATPLITSVENDNQAQAVFGRLVAQAMAPDKVAAYDSTMYTMIQGDLESGIPPKTKIALADILRLLVSTGIDPKSLQAFLDTKGASVGQRIPAHGQIAQTYGLSVTPSVALVGKFLVNPDHANSNPQQFLLLLNGLISRILQGGANAL